MSKPNTRDYVPVDLPDDPAGVSGATTTGDGGVGAGGSSTELTSTRAASTSDAADASTAIAVAPEATAAGPTTTDAPAVTRINVRTLTGQQIECELPGGEATATNTVADLKLAVEQVQGVPPSFQRLIYAGRELQDSQKLVDANIHHGNVVHLVLRQNAVPPPSAAAPAAADNNAPAGQPANLMAALAALNGGALAGGGNGAPAHDPHRVLQAFQMARIVKLFAIVDGCFLLIWAMSYSPLLAAVALCGAGWYGASKFRFGYVCLYILYLVGAVGFRLYLMVDGSDSRSLVLLLALGIVVELYIFNICCRFAKLLRALTPADRAELLPHDPHAAPVLPIAGAAGGNAGGGGGGNNGNGN